MATRLPAWLKPRGVVPAALAVATIGAGCSLVGDVPGKPIPPVVAELEVFNRTEADIFLVAADGERLDVPACGRALDETFRVEAVRVRSQVGYIRGFGAGDPAFAGRRLTLVEVASAADSGIPSVGAPPEPLPPCVGLPEAQPES